ncbi:MAG: hypothetical protein ABI806_28255 [Candidatus Solibacter sp.]
MSAFLNRAEEILEIAVAGTGDAGDLAIVIDRQGAMRMLEPAGWSLPAMCAEFGAAAAYRVERRGRTVRVEGWGGGDRCLLQRSLEPSSRATFPPFARPNFLEKYHAAS